MIFFKKQNEYRGDDCLGRSKISIFRPRRKVRGLSNRVRRLHVLIVISIMSFFTTNVTAVNAFRSLGHAEAGFVTEIAIARVGNTKVVTAVRDGAGKLALLSWRINEAGEINRTHKRVSIIASKITMIPLSDNRILTLVQNRRNKVTLATWDIADNGRIQLLRSCIDCIGLVSEVSVTALGANRVVTAVRDGQGNMALIPFNIAQNGGIRRLRGKDARSGLTHSISIATLSNNRVATVSVDGANKLALIIWNIANDGRVSRVFLGQAARQTVTNKVKIVALSPTKIVMAARLAGGSLKIIKRIITERGEVLNNVASTVQDLWANGMDDIGITGLEDEVVVVTNLAPQKMEIIKWNINDRVVFDQTGDKDYGTERVAITKLTDNRVVSAVIRSDNQHLMIDVWDENRNEAHPDRDKCLGHMAFNNSQVTNTHSNCLSQMRLRTFVSRLGRHDLFRQSSANNARTPTTITLTPHNNPTPGYACFSEEQQFRLQFETGRGGSARRINNESFDFRNQQPPIPATIHLSNGTINFPACNRIEFDFTLTPHAQGIRGDRGHVVFNR